MIFLCRWGLSVGNGQATQLTIHLLKRGAWHPAPVVQTHSKPALHTRRGVLWYRSVASPATNDESKKERTVKTSPAFLFCLLMSTASVCLSSPPNRPFSLTIQAVQERLHRDSQVELKLTLLNTSNTDITIRDTNRWCDYALEVRDRQGRSVPETDYKRSLNCGNRVAVTVGRRIITSLKPGQSYSDTMLVNQIYDFRRPGEYSIQATRNIPDKFGPVVIKSNSVRIVITN